MRKEKEKEERCVAMSMLRLHASVMVVLLNPNRNSRHKRCPLKYRQTTRYFATDLLLSVRRIGTGDR